MLPIFVAGPARLLFIDVALAFVGVLFFANAGTIVTSSNAGTPSVQSAGERVNVEVVTLRPHGFEPSEITRSRGQFLLVLQNRTGLADITLEVTDAAARKAKTKRLINMKRWRELIDLPPGTYVLSETRRQWRCLITITAQ